MLKGLDPSVCDHCIKAKAMRLDNVDTSGQRECLKCSKIFGSDHAYNRLCKKCNEGEEIKAYDSWGCM